MEWEHETETKTLTPELLHRLAANYVVTLDIAVEHIKAVHEETRVHGQLTRPRWPMIVLNSPNGWTGPKVVDGQIKEGGSRASQRELRATLISAARRREIDVVLLWCLDR